MTRQERRLAAILAADVAGYSRLMAVDEPGTLARFNALRAELIDPKIAQFKGRVVGTAGDSLLVEFASAVDAVQCAVEAQERIAARNADIPKHRRIVFRMGINLGDVIAEGDTIHGDGVNVAARLERLGEPGRVLVTRAIFDQVKGKLPYAFTDLGEHTVKNIAERVRAYGVGQAVQTAAVHVPSNDLPLPSKPSVAVLPFTNMSGDPEQAYFSDGITEDIITELSRDRGLFVIARNSSFMFKGPAVDIAEVGRKLGVRYVVEGSVRKVGRRIRITAQLIEASGGNHVWAERYDRDLEDIFAVQDEVSERVVWALVGRVTTAEIDRSKRRKFESLDSYDLVLRGIEAFHRFTSESMSIAIRFFQSAIELDPASARAHSWLAWALSYGSFFEGDFSKRERSRDTAKHALELGDTGGLAEAVLAGYCGLRGDFAGAEVFLDKAAKKEPNNPHVMSWKAYCRLWEGRSLEAREVAERLWRLDPLDPGWNHSVLAYACYLLGDYEASLEWFRKWDNSEHYRGLANLAACLAQLGRLDEARDAWGKCIESKLGFTIEEYKRGSPYHRAEDLAHWLDGLRKAGVTE